MSNPSDKTGMNALKMELARVQQEQVDMATAQRATEKRHRAEADTYAKKQEEMEKMLADSDAARRLQEEEARREVASLRAQLRERNEKEPSLSVKDHEELERRLADSNASRKRQEEEARREIASLRAQMEELQVKGSSQTGTRPKSQLGASLPEASGGNPKGDANPPPADLLGSNSPFTPLPKGRNLFGNDPLPIPRFQPTQQETDLRRTPLPHSQESRVGPDGTNVMVIKKEQPPPTISAIDPIKWTTFRRQFETASIISGWKDSLAVQKLTLSVKEEAAQATEHISLPLSITLEGALDKYEAIFITPSGQDMAEMEFEQSKRKSDETLLAWHTRLRSLFIRAYPDEDYNSARKLKNHFVLSLRDRALSMTLKISPEFKTITYAVLLTRAQEIYAGMQSVKTSALPSLNAIFPESDEQSGINALNTGEAAVKCHFCSNVGHIIRNCPSFSSAVDRIKKNPKAFGLSNEPSRFPRNANPRRGFTSSSSTSSSSSSSAKRGRSFTRTPRRGGRPQAPRRYIGSMKESQGSGDLPEGWEDMADLPIFEKPQPDSGN